MWILVALAAGAGVALVVGASALGDTVCGTNGDLTDCAQWGVDGNATRLAIENTGSMQISSFTFTLPSGTTVSGVAGTTHCTWAANQVSCTIPIAPGQTVFVDILYSGQAPPVGSTGVLTLSDANNVSQPGQTVSLQGSTVCGTNPCTISSTATSTSTMISTNTMTSTGTPPGGTPPACQAHLTVTKALTSSNYAIKVHRDLYVTFKGAGALHYEIFVRNDSSCPATGVVLSDALPHDFDCAGGDWHFVAGEQPPRSNVPCKGEGRHVMVDIGTLGVDQTVVIEVRGKFPAEHATANTARATATNAPTEHSDHIHVDVVSRKQFEADRGKLEGQP